MIMVLIRKFWKEIALVILIGMFLSSLYFLYQRTVNLEKKNTEYEVALEASEKTIETLTLGSGATAKANEENAKERARIGSELVKTQQQLRTLLNEQTHNCLNQPFSDSLIDRL